MRHSIIADLYNGEIHPAETLYPSDPEYRPLEKKISSEEESLKKKLSAEDAERLETLGNLYRYSSGMSSSASFTHGFKLGALLMYEICGESGRNE